LYFKTLIIKSKNVIKWFAKNLNGGIRVKKTKQNFTRIKKSSK